MIPQCLDLGVGVIPWSPLARGLLARPRSAIAGTPRGVSDKYTEELYSESNHDIVDSVEAIASERGVTMAQVAMAWVMSRPGVTAPIVGATRLSHLEDAIGAVEIVLSEDEVKRLEDPYRPRSVAGH